MRARPPRPGCESSSTPTPTARARCTTSSGASSPPAAPGSPPPTSPTPAPGRSSRSCASGLRLIQSHLPTNRGQTPLGVRPRWGSDPERVALVGAGEAEEDAAVGLGCRAAVGAGAEEQPGDARTAQRGEVRAAAEPVLDAVVAEVRPRLVERRVAQRDLPDDD